MKKLFWSARLIAVLAIIASACTDPTTIGADLLEEDRALIRVVDTLSVNSTTVEADSVLTFAPNINNQLATYLFGDFQDPIFGRAKSSIYIQPRLARLLPNFEDSTLDSIILVLPYDTTGIYGDIDDEFGIEVFRLEEDMDRTRLYYSTQSFALQPEPIGELSFRPTTDSISVYRYSGGSADRISFPHLRVPLDMELGRELLSYDSTITSSDSAFLTNFKGIYINPTVATPGMLAFDILSSQGGIFLYYREGGSTFRQFQVEFGQFTAKSLRYEHDYSGSLVSEFLGSSLNDQDSLAFLQGMAGVNATIEFPTITTLPKDIVVNKAELEIYVAELPGSPLEVYPPVDQVVVSAINDRGELFFIDDVALAGSELDALFGGLLRETAAGQPSLYQMNITTHFQEMATGEQSPILFLSAIRKADRASRTAIYGAGHPLYAPKLRITFSTLD